MQVLNVFRPALKFGRVLGSVAAQASCSLNPIFRKFSQMSLAHQSQSMLSLESALSLNSIRHKKQPRDYFPRANERKRQLTHGWRVRMLTPNGRRILMRRILKGKHVLSH